MKKAGLIVGVCLILLTFVILVVSNGIKNQKEAVKYLPETISSIDEEESTEETSNDVLEKETVLETKSIVEVKPNNDILNSQIIKVDIASLGDYVSQSEVSLIANKSVYYLNKDSHNSVKELVYCIDFYLNDGTSLYYFVSKAAFDKLDIGTQVKVSYDKYTSKVKTFYYVVSGVSLLSK